MSTNTKHEGDLTITNDNAGSFAHITEVSGGLYIKAAGASLPALTSVGGWLWIQAAGASMPVLTSVGSKPYKQP